MAKQKRAGIAKRAGKHSAASRARPKAQSKSDWLRLLRQVGRRPRKAQAPFQQSNTSTGDPGKDADQQRLLQTKTLGWLKREIPLADLMVVWLSDRLDEHSHGLYCALIESKRVRKSLKSTSWDLSHGDGLPGTVVRYEGRKKRAEYLRYGDDDGVQPLVIDRDFFGIHEDSLEISEEFRHFHRLYHDRKSDRYLKMDKAGNEEVVAVVRRDQVSIRLKEILQFAAIKEMHLVIQFDYREHSIFSLRDLGLRVGGGEYSADPMVWGLHYGDFGGFANLASFSRLLGKRMIAPLPKVKSEFWGFAEEKPKQHVDFVIGLDKGGDQVAHTSNPDKLANYFGANPKAPHYLTPVHFSKEVLDKYYGLPSRFSVEDSYLRCGALWGLQMDNHHPDRVVAWLGDLGRDLPFEEQLHWRAHNVAPRGGVSETYLRRQLLAQFTESNRPEDLFRRRYRELAEACETELGWQLLLPLGPGDEHHFQCMRIPAKDEQKEFDELVLALAKILIDSLNEAKLDELIDDDVRKGLKGGITRLEIALGAAPDGKAVIAFLRKLQTLRSSSAAHRKGRNFKSIATEFDIDRHGLRDVFGSILDRAIGSLVCLRQAVLAGTFK